MSRTLGVTVALAHFMDVPLTAQAFRQQEQYGRDWNFARIDDELVTEGESK